MAKSYTHLTPEERYSHQEAPGHSGIPVLGHAGRKPVQHHNRHKASSWMPGQQLTPPATRSPGPAR